MFFCIPILLGCQTQIKPEGEQFLVPCPRCHNQSVLPVKSTTWLEFFWVPVIPLSRKRLWVCHICQWSDQREKIEMQPRVVVASQQYQPYGNWVPPNVPGYQPAYFGQPQAAAVGNAKA